MPDQAPAPDTPVTSMLGGEPGLSPATADDLVQTLAFALRYQGRKRVDTAGLAMARSTAERLAEHLQACGFVVMRKPVKPQGPNPAQYVYNSAGLTPRHRESSFAPHRPNTVVFKFPRQNPTRQCRSGWPNEQGLSMDEIDRLTVNMHLRAKHAEFCKDATTLFYPATYREACRQLAEAVALLLSHNLLEKAPTFPVDFHAASKRVAATAYQPNGRFTQGYFPPPKQKASH